jgi:phage terminase large subunit-like protein
VTDYAATIEAYCRSVESGERIAGELEKLAVQRYREDIEQASERGLYFDEAIAAEAIAFFPICRHSIGQWNNQPFELSPWQQFAVWNIFGWRRTVDKTRRFRKVHISVARKNGKSTFVAALGLMLLCFDNPQEPAAEVYVAATKEAQAVIIHREATRMRDKSPSLRKLIKSNKNNLYMPSNGSFFRPLGSDSDSTDGLNPHAVLKDELHAWQERHRGLHEKLSTGGASRRQPLEVIITTAGDDKSEIWMEEDAYCRRILDSVGTGTIISDNLFCMLFVIDKKDDPFDESCWPKANPNLHVSVKLEYLQEQATEAKGKPTARNAFIRYHCNRQVTSTERAIDPLVWHACATACTQPELSEGFGGIDIGRRDDWAAVSIILPRDTGDELKSYDLHSWAFTSEEAAASMKPQPFAGWQTHPRLHLSQGATVEFAAVRDTIVDLAHKYKILSWAYDPTFAQQLAQELDNDYGLPMFDFLQSPKKYTEPIKAFNRALVDKRVAHDGDALLGWQMMNLTVRRNYKDEWMPDKSGKGKIDAAVATLMAFSEAMFHEKESTPDYNIIWL